MAVAKLARAYKIDEIATSVLTMQSASALDEVAQKVLKKNPTNMDAAFVHFFHEKIPSRMLAANTTTKVLDALIQANPSTPEYYRTRALVYGFQEQFSLSLRDLKLAISLSRKRRKMPFADSHSMHDGGEDETCCENQLFFLRGASAHQFAVSLIDKALQEVSNKTEAAAQGHVNGQTAVNGDLQQSPAVGMRFWDKTKAHLPLFLKAIQPYKDQIHSLAKKSIKDFIQFLSQYPTGLDAFDHTSAGSNNTNSSNNNSNNTTNNANGNRAADATPNTPSPTTPATPNPEVTVTEKQTAIALHEFLHGLPIKSLNAAADSTALVPSRKDSSETLIGSDSGSLSASSSVSGGSSKAVADYDRQCTSRCTCTNSPKCDELSSPTIGTYHPLLLEAWYAIALNYMILGDWHMVARWHERMADLQAHLEGYPVFLPARSMSQADYLEILRLLKKTVMDRIKSEKTRVESAASLPGPAATAASTPAVNGVSKAAGVDATVGAPAQAASAVEPVKANGAVVPASPVGKNAANGKGKAPLEPPKSKHYTLHTKRADTLHSWLQKDLYADFHSTA
ncbi:hypothetical protein HDU76_003268 [Blyttiomyces sp. JEL0837]|nr:hypothetical protein HDU76_003268 [Blyttiomyces sp. JEL0837]